MRLIVVLCLVTASCKSGDDCAAFFDKVAPVAKNLPGGEQLVVGKDTFMSRCRNEHQKFVDDPLTRCVFAAADDNGVKACIGNRFDQYKTAAGQVEAQTQLQAIYARAAGYFAAHNTFPIGTTNVLPEPPQPKGTGAGCCGAPPSDNHCPPSSAWAQDPVWKTLGFSIAEPTTYRYSYASTDGKTFNATAEGDLDCDGKPAVFKLHGSLDANGKPTAAGERPPAGVL